MAHDSFFRWGFFNSILRKKETLFQPICSKTHRPEMLEARA
jgi:hypothetical protein